MHHNRKNTKTDQGWISIGPWGFLNSQQGALLAHAPPGALEVPRILPIGASSTRRYAAGLVRTRKQAEACAQTPPSPAGKTLEPPYMCHRWRMAKANHSKHNTSGPRMIRMPRPLLGNRIGIPNRFNLLSRPPLPAVRAFGQTPPVGVCPLM